MSNAPNTYIVEGQRGAISSWFRKHQLLVDPLSQIYTESILWFGFFRYRTTKALPKIKYVLVFRQLFAKCEPCELGEFEDDGLTWYQVSLVHGQYRRIIIHETRQRQQAFEKATELALVLNLKVLDSATNRRLGTWIDPISNRISAS